MDKRERCLLAKSYHGQGMNCAQSIMASFCFGICSSFGGGVRCGSICGAITGALMVLGMLHPHNAENGQEGKRRSTAMTQEFERRFIERFHQINCRELLADHDLRGTAMAEELGVTNHCDILIVSAVELLCDYLEELEKE